MPNVMVLEWVLGEGLSRGGGVLMNGISAL